MPRPSNFRREEILDKAMELFWSRPYKEIHLSDIEAYMGLKRSNLYDHFESKEDLFRQAFERYREQCIRQMLDMLVNQTSILDGFRLFFSRLVICLSTPELLKQHFPDPRVPLLKKNEGQLLVSNMRLNPETIQKIFREALKIGIRKKEYAKGMDVTERSSMLWTLYDGIITNSTFDKDSDDLQSMADSALEIIKHDRLL